MLSGEMFERNLFLGRGMDVCGKQENGFVISRLGKFKFLGRKFFGKIRMYLFGTVVV